MKKQTYIFILLMFNMHLLLAQNWKDSLSAGQQAFQDKQYSEAFRMFKHAQELAPKGVDIKELMNQAAYKGKNYGEAVKGYSEASKQAKTDEAKTTANYNLGNAQFKNKDVDAAIESYKNALRADPTNQQARYNLAYAMNQKNQNDKNKNDQNKNDQNKNDQNKNQDQNKGDGDPNKNKPQPNDPNKGNEGNNKNPQPQTDQLSQDQTDRLLDAMAKSDQNVQKKLDKSKDTLKAILNTKKKDW